MPDTSSVGVELIAAERQRQIDGEGRTPEHDSHHGDGELAKAAVAYAQQPDDRDLVKLVQDPADGGWYFDNSHTRATCPPRCPCAKRNIPADAPIRRVPSAWPFDPPSWKPGDRVRELVKAGALIAAEIDRLTRAGAVVSAREAGKETAA